MGQPTGQVSLREQLGALAVIDDMRHRDMVVQEHLDLPKRRAEVILRVREFYASRGVEVDDATIEQGVKAYFDRRLTFEAPELTPMQERLARLYITRGRWLGKTVWTLATIGAIAAFLHF